MNKNSITLLWLLAGLLPLSAHAQLTVQESFNGNTTTNLWTALGGACLTASTNNATSATPPAGTIPGCVSGNGGNLNASNYYYKNVNGGSVLVGGNNGGNLPDASGSGALRLTNGANSSMSGANGNNETGAIVSANSFPSNSGLHITFNTITWGGNGYNNGSANTGADGMAFFLLDASLFSTTGTGDNTVFNVTKTGSFGGALGYDCSPGKSPADGFKGGYIGLGIDEYGNFANKGDNGRSYDPLSPGFAYNTITLRGSGNITSTRFPVDSNDNATGVNPGAGPIVSTANVCKYGFYTTSNTPTVTSSSAAGSFSSGSTGTTTSYNTTALTYTVTVKSNNTDSNGVKTKITQTSVYPIQMVRDYDIIAVKPLIPGNNIYNQESIAKPTRLAAVPISYTINITSTGKISISYSYNGGVNTTVINSQDITDYANYYKGLPDNFLYGFSAGTGGGSNNHEITCFKAAQIADSSSSAGGNVPQNTKVQNNQGDQIYLASYNPTTLAGSLTATPLSVQPNGSVVVGTLNSNGTINPHATWDASCVLTGAASCATTKTAVAVQAPSARGIATWNDASSAGVPFQWSNLSTNEQTALNSGDPSNGLLGPDRVDFLRGNRTKEVTNVFRTRTGVLGDIINSSPVWVGTPLSPFTQKWTDAIYASAMPEGSTSYATFQSNQANRLNVVYVGANDGYLHGFSAGQGIGATFNQTSNTGAEILAYMPSLAINSIHDVAFGSGELDYSGLTYAHNAFVDATPGSGDLYYGGAWHTWLIGGLGDGGNMGGVLGSPTGTASGNIYALDITNPSSTPTDSSVAAMVLGDWNSSTISCDNVSNCGQYLGSVYGTPIIRRLHSGNWAAIFGNGLNSAQGTAGIFVMEVSSSSTATPPTTTFHYYDTNVGAGNDPTGQNTSNGIAYVTSADLDGDHVTDYVYAGDALGNLWRFDLTSQNPTNWGNPFVLFNGSSSSGLQPITSAVTVNATVYGSNTYIMIDFGTGRQYPQTLGSAAVYATAAQNMYGIWDWNMSKWNTLNTNAPYAYLKTSSSPFSASAPMGPSNLTQQQLTAINITTTTNTTGTSQGYQETNNLMCLPGVSGCSSSITYGWMLPLPNSTEQIIYNPITESGILFINSIIPAVVDNLKCTITAAAGFSYAIDAGNGGGSVDVFNSATGEVSTTSTPIAPIVGLGLNGVGTPYFVTSADPSGNTINTMITQTQSGVPAYPQVHIPCNGPNCNQCVGASCASNLNNGSRLSWLEIR